MKRGLDRPVVAGVIATLAALVLVLLRLLVAVHGDVTSFIVVGTGHVAGTGLPHGVHVVAGSGYDGQFYFRQALDPFDTAMVAHGIRLDAEFRLQRIGYPLITWLVSGGGRTGLVPVALVSINVVGLGVIGWLGGMLAAEARRHALAGLLLPAYFGFTMTLARDLAEIVEVAFLLGAILVFRRGRYVWAGFLFSVAVVTKETEAAVVAGYAVAIAVFALRRSFRSRRQAWLSIIEPAVAFCAVQLWLLVVTGHLAFTSDEQGNLAAPLVAPVRAVSRYLSHPTVFANAIWLGELAVLAVVVLAALLTLTSTSARFEERTGFVFLVVLTLSLSSYVWNGQSDFRALAPLYALASVVLLGSRRRLGFFYVVCGIALLVGFVHRAAFL